MGAAYWLLPTLTGQPLRGGRWLRVHAWLAPAAVLGAFLAFLAAGYAAPAILFSVLNEISWYLFAWLLWQNVRPVPLRRWPAALVLLVSATAQLLLSTLGTWLLVAAVASGGAGGGGWLRSAGIALFLHAFGDGWLVAGAMALLVALQTRLTGRPLAAGPAWWLLGLQLLGTLGFLRLLAPAAALAAVGRLGSLALGLAELGFLCWIIPGLARRPAHDAPSALDQGSGASPGRALAAVALGFLAVKALLEFAAFLPAWPEWAQRRPLILAYLHLKLLGVYAAALLAWCAGTLHLRPAGWRWWVGLYALGAAVMVGALTGGGLHAPTLAWGRFWQALAFASALPVLAGASALLPGWRDVRTAAAAARAARNAPGDQPASGGGNATRNS